jgi:hypothetical protein
MKPLLVALVASALATASCGSDRAVDPASSGGGSAQTTIDLDAPQPGDEQVDEDLPEFEDDIVASRQETARADLMLAAVAAPDVVAPGDRLVLTVIVTSVDTDFVNAPTVVATLPNGLTAGVLAPDCRVDGSTVTCRVAPSILSESGQVPVSADPFEIELVVGAGASGTLVVSLAAESLDNPVANDPNPADNVVDLSVTVS